MLSKGLNYDQTYRFEGYEIYQLKDASVSVADILNPDFRFLSVVSKLRSKCQRFGACRRVSYGLVDWLLSGQQTKRCYEVQNALFLLKSSVRLR